MRGGGTRDYTLATLHIQLTMVRAWEFKLTSTEDSWYSLVDCIFREFNHVVAYWNRNQIHGYFIVPDDDEGLSDHLMEAMDVFEWNLHFQDWTGDVNDLVDLYLGSQYVKSARASLQIHQNRPRNRPRPPRARVLEKSTKIQTTYPSVHIILHTTARFNDMNLILTQFFNIHTTKRSSNLKPFFSKQRHSVIAS